MYECEIWTIKKAEHQRIDIFELWCYGHVWMWELDYKESWEPSNWCFWTVLLEKTLESPLDCKEIQPVHPKDQSWVSTGRTDAEVKTPILWPPDAKSWLIWKDPDAGKDWGQETKGTTEDEMVGWLHWLDGHGFGWTVGVGDGQGGLTCCGSWGHKESNMTEGLNWTELMWVCERWTTKSESRRIDAFKLWRWRTLLRVPWAAEDQTSQS